MLIRYPVGMPKRTTVELYERLLARAKRALGTARATIDEALRRAANEAEGEQHERADRQLSYLRTLADRADPVVLASDEMWR